MTPNDVNSPGGSHGDGRFADIDPELHEAASEVAAMLQRRAADVASAPRGLPG